MQSHVGKLMDHGVRSRQPKKLMQKFFSLQPSLKDNVSLNVAAIMARSCKSSVVMNEPRYGVHTRHTTTRSCTSRFAQFLVSVALIVWLSGRKDGWGWVGGAHRQGAGGVSGGGKRTLGLTVTRPRRLVHIASLIN